MVSKHLDRVDLAEAARLDQNAVRFHPEEIKEALDGSGTDHLGAMAVSFALSSSDILLLRSFLPRTSSG